MHGRGHGHQLLITIAVHRKRVLRELVLFARGRVLRLMLRRGLLTNRALEAIADDLPLKGVDVHTRGVKQKRHDIELECGRLHVGLIDPKPIK